MSHRVPVSVSAVAVLVALVSLGAAPLAAQTTPPRTAWGSTGPTGCLGLPHDHAPATARGAGRQGVLDRGGGCHPRTSSGRPEHPPVESPRRTDDGRRQRGQADGRNTGLLQQFLVGPRNDGRRDQAHLTDCGSAKRATASLDGGGGAASCVARSTAHCRCEPRQRPRGFMGGPGSGGSLHPARQSRPAHQPWWLQQ